MEAALQYDRHPLLHENLKGFCINLFKIAANSLEHYQTLKQKRGLIDFVDQEQLLLAALDETGCDKCIKGRTRFASCR